METEDLVDASIHLTEIHHVQLLELQRYWNRMFWKKTCKKLAFIGYQRNL